MEFFRKNLNTNFIRICRIQISSKLRNQNLYPDHFYNIEFYKNNIYNLDNPSQLKTHKLQLFANMNNPLYFINSNDFYVKINNDTDNYYIDIGTTIETFSTNIHVNIDTVNDGSITFFCDPANQDEYTRLRFNVTNNAILANSNSLLFLFSNQSITYRLLLAKTKFTHVNTNTLAFMDSDGTLINGNNDNFSITIEDNDNYSKNVTITSKTQGNILIENMII